MVNDEHEMLVEYSEMTAFNFKSQEYQEIKQDFSECKKVAHGIDWMLKNFISRFKPSEA